MSYWNKEVKFEELIGKVFIKIEKVGDDEIYFHTNDGQILKMYHDQDCCESVYIEDICGDLDDLINSPITMAEEIYNVDEDALNEYDDSFTWTFYKFATSKGYVTIRWYGTSNGYYSESVNFVVVNNEDLQ